MKTVAIFGASGFVGSTLVERLTEQKQYEVRPFIHTTGNAWRLTRRGLKLQCVDMLSPQQVRQAVSGCSHVVNCSRGSEQLMFEGLGNLLNACRSSHVERFVHLSSVAVYGEPPSPASACEDAEPNAVKGTYGWIKLRQDQMVSAACRRGLPAVVLCPPNISGAYSQYMLSILNAICDRSLALVADGSMPCVLVDVQNLCHAIELAFVSRTADGKRLFITDDADTTWADVVHGLSGLAPDVPLHRFTIEEAKAACAPATPPRASLVGVFKHLLSGDVRRILRQDPLAARVELWLHKLFSTLPRRLQNSSRRAVTGPIRVDKFVEVPRYDARLLAHQLRGVRHRTDRASTIIGYRPEVTSMDSMAAFTCWIERLTGWGSEWWDLASKI